MADQWYYAHEGQQSGPVSIEQLKQLAACGQLQASDLVWQQGMASWAPASTLEGLFAAAGGPSPPPPGVAPGPAGAPPQPGAPQPAPYGSAPGYSVAMRFTLPNLSVGAWIILGATLLVVVSLFLKWTKEDYAGAMGLINPWVMFIAVFIYPVWMLVAGRPIHLVGGILCGAWGAIAALFWILKFTASAMGITISMANVGLYLYLISCLALIPGVILYKPTGWRLFR